MSPVKVIERGRKGKEYGVGHAFEFEWRKPFSFDLFGLVVSSEYQGFRVSNLDFQVPNFSFLVVPDKEVVVDDDTRKFMDKYNIKSGVGKLTIGNRMTLEATNQNEEEAESWLNFYRELYKPRRK